MLWYSNDDKGISNKGGLSVKLKIPKKLDWFVSNTSLFWTQIWVDQSTYYMQHQVVTQAMCAVNPDQYTIFQGGTEANGQPISPGAWSLIGWPTECNEASSFAKDVRGPSWTEGKRKGAK